MGAARVAVLISGSGSNLEALIRATRSGAAAGEIVLVISNRADAFGLERARRHGIATAVELWPYSNYLEWIEQRPGNLVDRAFVQAHFPAPGQYQAYVASYVSGQVKLPDGLAAYLEELENE